MNPNRLLVLTLAVPALFALAHCGGGGSDSPTPAAPPPAATPAPPPAPGPVTLSCDPTPPPLRGWRMKIHQNQGRRKTLDATPQVMDVDNYCQRTGQDGDFCFTRREGDPHRADCDRMAVGMAGDTGRYGPTWFFEGGPCVETVGEGESGCSNHPDNQFLVIAKGTGRVAACASEDVLIEGDRCGECIIEPSNLGTGAAACR